MRRLGWLIGFILVSIQINAQSLELMVGNQGVFADVQWLKPLDSTFRWSVFSRGRATVSYEGETNLFLGAYVNYTSRPGIGLSLVGRIGSSSTGGDLGVHFFKKQKIWMLFALLSAGLNAKRQLEYSWFSIFTGSAKTKS